MKLQRRKSKDFRIRRALENARVCFVLEYLQSRWFTAES